MLIAQKGKPDEQIKNSRERNYGRGNKTFKDNTKMEEKKLKSFGHMKRIVVHMNNKKKKDIVREELIVN